MPKNKWKPTSTLENLRQRAEILHQIRLFFYHKKILEVETPILSWRTVPDPYLYSLSTLLSKQKKLYLQTSPEFAMKRLLAAGTGAIYQITKAFRDDEVGHRHNPEFTLLEWYRPDFNHYQLMDEVDELLQKIANFPPAVRKTYQSIFYEYLEINPLTTSIDKLQQCALYHGVSVPANLTDLKDADKDTWLHLLLSYLIEPKLGQNKPLFIYDFPASQAALSKIYTDQSGYAVAERFELFIYGMEIANGFHELTDPQEQRTRFLANLTERQRLSLPPLRLDDYFLAALEYGLPECAGVALGIDRLLMAILSAKSIDQVISFTIKNA